MPESPRTLDAPRLRREQRTLVAMLRLYCRAKHGARGALCASCRELAAYAAQRLARCPFGGRKPACSKCPIHCYRPALREQVRAVMRYAGPRMLWRHPVLALLHVWDGRRRVPPQKRPLPDRED